LKALLLLKIRLMKDNFTLYIIMIAMSLVIAGVFGNSMGGTYKPTIAVIDEDLSVSSSEVINHLSADHGFNVKLLTVEEAMTAVTGRDVIAAVVLKDQFYAVENGIEIIQTRETVETYQLSNVLQNEITLIRNIMALDTRATDIISAEVPGVDVAKLSHDIKTTYVAHWDAKKPISWQLGLFEAENALTGNLSMHYIVGMTLFFVTYSLMFTVGDILEDKRLHTLDRMLVSPSTRIHMLSANLICAMIIGSIQIAVMVLAGQYLFGVDWGSQILLIIGIGILYIFVMTALSLFVVSLMKTMAQLGAVSPIVLTGMGMLGGCMWPLEIITSKALLTIANFTPHKWAISAIEGIVVTGKIDQATITSVSVLLIMGIAYLIMGERVLYFKSLKDN